MEIFRSTGFLEFRKEQGTEKSVCFHLTSACPITDLIFPRKYYLAEFSNKKMQYKRKKESVSHF